MAEINGTDLITTYILTSDDPIQVVGGGGPRWR